MRLTTRVHDRDVAGMTYVYPVVSRRAGGVSVGVNLNPNNACNWRCVYCQVPNLVRGAGPDIDLELLESELDTMLRAITQGDYMERHVPERARRWNDVAFSGNGEPTSSPQFAEAIGVVREVVARYPQEEPVKLVLITNGSLVHQPRVQEGLSALAAAGGEVWFKMDSGTDEGIRRMNDASTTTERTRERLVTCAGLAPTWVQTMVLKRAGEPPTEAECTAYLDALADVLARGATLEGVLLYGLARTSYQPEATELAPLPGAWMQAYAARIEALGLEVRLSL